MHTLSRRFIAVSSVLASIFASPRGAEAQSLDSEVPAVVARGTEAPPTPRAAMIPIFDARAYRERSIALFATAALGHGTPPGTSTQFTAGINLALTLRNVWGGFLLDAGADFVLNVLCFGGGSCPPIQFQPSIRAGYTSAVSTSLAIGVRAGYAPALAVSIPGSAGFLHQVDADVHFTAVTRRGALIEPFVSGGVLVGADRSGNVAPFPVALLGLRIGAAL